METYTIMHVTYLKEYAHMNTAVRARKYCSMHTWTLQYVHMNTAVHTREHFSMFT
jgi:hypothetical protein